jgi:hypothetical protein
MNEESDITLAVIQRDIQHLREITELGFSQLKADIQEVKITAAKNSDRIDKVKEQQDKQSGQSKIIDGIVAAVAIVGSILGIRS